MAEKINQSPVSKRASRANKRLWLAPVLFILAFAAVFIYKSGRLNQKSLEEQLAAIEAKRTIEDEENAALIYNKLLEDFDMDSFHPDFWDSNFHDKTFKKPWSSKDFPELAKWLNSHENTINILLEATKKEKCRFLIIIDFSDPNKANESYRRSSSIRRWARLLIFAGNNDLGEGRTDEALKKYFAVLQMANHLYQQPVLTNILVGYALESLGTARLKELIIEHQTTPDHLDIIENKFQLIQNYWKIDWKMTSDVEHLSEIYERRRIGLLRQLKQKYQFRGLDDKIDYIHNMILSERAGTRILIALKRYKDKNGDWPESLEDIKTSASSEFFIDPVNKGEYIYKRTQDGFQLYSKGKNNVDDNGKDDYNSDDRRADDRMIWPTYTYKKQQEDTNDE
ncbi:MAG: hypothetical protein ACYTBP_15165 [Planctomycetota bacterium]|jgi:hypothetical protein